MSTECNTTILIVSPSLKAGGMERVATVLANHLSQEKSIDTHLVTLIDFEPFFELTHEVTFHKGLASDSKGFLVQTWQAVIGLRKLIKKIRPEAVISFGDRYNSLTILSSLGTRCKVFVSNRQNPNVSNGKIIDFLNWLFYRFSNGIIAQTTKAKDVFEKKYSQNNICVIGNPFTIPKQLPEKRKKIILNVGRFGDAKNQFELIEIFDQCNVQPDWNLIFVGDGHKKEKTLRAREQAKKKDKIRIEDFSDKIEDYYKEASIFAFTSYSEGFPNALGEAMSYGCACISYDCVAGPSELIDDGINGYLIPLGDKAQFKAKLQALINDVELRARFGKAAREKMEKFTVNKVAQQYLDFMIGNS